MKYDIVMVRLTVMQYYNIYETATELLLYNFLHLDLT